MCSYWSGQFRPQTTFAEAKTFCEQNGMNLFVPNVANENRARIELRLAMNALAVEIWGLTYWIGGMYNKCCSRNTRTNLVYYTTNRKQKFRLVVLGNWCRPDPDTNSALQHRD